MGENKRRMPVRKVNTYIIHSLIVATVKPSIRHSERRAKDARAPSHDSFLPFVI